mgnify:CR=1 FL=1
MVSKDSFHRPKHKLATFQNYSFRAYNILKNENNLNKEIEIIKATAKINGYQTEIIDKI